MFWVSVDMASALPRIGDGKVALIVHYEYMALAKKTFVLLEAMLLFVESSRSVVNNSKIAPQSMGTFVEAMFNKAKKTLSRLPIRA